MSAVGVCGASPLAAPAGLPLRSAPRRAQRAASAHRASNERATSAELVRTSLARPSFGSFGSVGRVGRVERSAVGRVVRVGRVGRSGRSAVGRSCRAVRSPAVHRRRPRGASRSQCVGPSAGGRWGARASALPRRGRGWGAPSPLLAGEGGAPPLIPARGGPRRSARAERPLSCADGGGGAPSGLPLRPATALGLFRAAPPVLPPRARRARV